ncbi:MAG: hypothetical protein HQL16_06860 [Candidatus Omnitrophica bacterium]|nr:hypothetical protein [Candidatus Omnitrophota bacterium]
MVQFQQWEVPVKRLLFLGCGAFVLWHFFAPLPKATWHGLAAPAEPVQAMDALPAPWKLGQKTITPRARYEIKAVVLSKHHYWAGRDEDDISPYDLALGWGVMSDAAVINALKVSQYGRWYNYTWQDAPPADPGDIARHSSNNHIVAASRNIASKIEALKRLDVVFLKGYLVDITQPDGWSWETSLRRDDSGGGACELFWVDTVEYEKGAL